MFRALLRKAFSYVAVIAAFLTLGTGLGLLMSGRSVEDFVLVSSMITMTVIYILWDIIINDDLKRTPKQGQ
jgi:hypothetical protein